MPRGREKSAEAFDRQFGTLNSAASVLRRLAAGGRTSHRIALLHPEPSKVVKTCCITTSAPHLAIGLIGRHIMATRFMKRNTNRTKVVKSLGFSNGEAGNRTQLSIPAERFDQGSHQKPNTSSAGMPRDGKPKPGTQKIGQKHCSRRCGKCIIVIRIVLPCACQKTHWFDSDVADRIMAMPRDAS